MGQEKHKDSEIGAAVTHTEAKDMLHSFIEVDSRFSEDKGSCIFVVGETGIGKNGVIRQVARERNLGIIPIPLRNMELAYKRISMENVVDEIIEEIEKALEKHDGVILLFEYLNRVNPEVQKIIRGWVRARMIGKYKLPANVYMIATASRVEEDPDSYIDKELMMYNIKLRIHSRPEDFSEYAQAIKLHPAVIAFVEFHPSEFNKRVHIGNSVYDTTPKTLESLSNYMYKVEKENRYEEDTAFIIGRYIGSYAGLVHGYYTALLKSPVKKQIDDILKFPFGQREFYPKTRYDELMEYAEKSEKSHPLSFGVPLMFALTLYNNIELKDSPEEDFIKGVKMIVTMFECLFHASRDKSEMGQAFADDLKIIINRIFNSIKQVMEEERKSTAVQNVLGAIHTGILLGDALLKGDKLDGDLIGKYGRNFVELCSAAAGRYITYIAKSQNKELADYYTELIEHLEVANDFAKYISKDSSAL